MRLNPFRREQRDDAVSGLENPSVDLITAITAMTDGVGSTAISLTPQKSMRLTAVYACVRVVAESISSLPLPITKSDGNAGREFSRNDPRWSLLNAMPNPEQTMMELLETWIAHAMLWGIGYLFIVRNEAGVPIELWPLRPDATYAVRAPSGGELFYRTHTADGKPRDLLPEEVIPLKSILGISPVMTAREAVTSAMAAEEYSGHFWANNARPGGVITLPEDLDDDEYKEFKARWRAGHEGLKRAQLVGILTNGATWKDVSIAPGLAQFIETRQFSVREIARLFRVPPHVIGDLEGSVTRASIEQQSIEFVTFTLRPWLVRAEQALRVKLFNRRADKLNDVYPEFQVEALMRGDVKSRYDAYAVGIQWGFLNREDARRIEGLPVPVGDDNLAEFLVPLNMISSKDLGKVLDLKTTPSQSETDTPQAERLLKAIEALSELGAAADSQVDVAGGLRLLALLQRNDPNLDVDERFLGVLARLAHAHQAELTAGDPAE